MRGCWQGEIEQVPEELRQWQHKLGSAPPDRSDTDPCRIIATTLAYPKTNRRLMSYTEHRRNGLPETTARMESLVKEINYRVQGTEIFWT